MKKTLRRLELAIFLTFTFLFLHSIHGWLYVPAPETGHVGQWESSPQASPEGSDTFSLDCSAKGRAIRTASQKIRIIGKACGAVVRSPASASKESTANQNVSVINETTQYSATVFWDDAGIEYSTDFIPLHPGKNTIRIEVPSRKAKIRTEVLEVDRS
jgi:hypothetical protein